MPVLVALLLTVQPEPLEAAAAHAKALEFTQAARALEQAELQRDLAREQVLTFWETKALVAAARGKRTEARTAFARLLVLNPRYTLKGRPGPKVTTPFFEAKTEAKEQGALLLTFVESVGSAEASRVVFSLQAPAGWVDHVRARIIEDGAQREVDLPPQPRVEVEVRGRSVAVGVVAMGAHGWLLSDEAIGTAEFVVEAESPPPPVAAPSLIPQSPVAPLVFASPIEKPLPRFRPAAYAVLILAAVGLGTGTVLGAVSAGGRSRFEDPLLTRAEAFALDSQIRTTAIAANAAFISAGALALTSVLLWIWGMPPAAP